MSRTTSLPAGSLPLLPLRRGVLLPGTTTTVPVGRRRSVELARSLRRNDHILVGVQLAQDVADPALADLHRVATLARVLRIARTDRGQYQLLVEGQRRVHVAELSEREPFLRAVARPVDEPAGDASAIGRLLTELGQEIASSAPKGAPVLKALEHLDSPEDAGVAADRVAALLGLPDEDEVAVLLTPSIEARLELVLDKLRATKARGELKSKLDKTVRAERNKAQREHLLREQMRAIQKELGDGDEDELSRLRSRLAAKELPDDVLETAERELQRLEGIGNQGAEAGVIRNYVEWILDLPWTERAEITGDLDAVEAKLDEDHFGLDDVKKAILEHLAVEQMGGEARGTILALAGPPGVGKTSLGQSVADATGRPFVRIALGGVRDEAEVRGHRRTYVGARPGRILHALKQVSVKNPVILLDEIDKLGQGWMGSPEAALLELLDPEQNHTFTDHFLELPFDLSEALFLCTVNDLSKLTAPLRDRLEIITVSGYTLAEKVRIARDHLIPKQLKKHNIEPDALLIDDGALEVIVRGYTREAGVRQLQREIRKLCRALALRIARSSDDSGLAVTTDSLADLLGRAKFYDQVAERTAQPGVATGMAWTPVGGDILFIETSSMLGKGSLKITGQLGDVMKESAHAALTYVRSHADELGIDPAVFASQDLHLHVPAGGVPKDGPSAGVTIFTALTSLLTGRRVRPDVAMTGECTLRGRVLPVGGIKEKVLAAHRAGLTRIVLPRRNERDLDDLPQEVRDELEFVLAEDMSEVLDAALDDTAAPMTGGHDETPEEASTAA